MHTPYQLIEDASGRLTLRRPGEDDVTDVRVRRSFPWSAPSRFVSIRSSEGSELLLLTDLAEVDAETRSLIERWLDQHTFVPKITRVDFVDATQGRQQWRVQTDRGPVEFMVQEREDIRFLPDGRFTVRDADGTLYELPRLDELDPPSRRAIESLL